MSDTNTTVYLVDDDLSVRRGLCRLIRAHGQQVEDFSSADDFLRRARLIRPCCILLDIRLPGIDGLGLQTLLKKNNVDMPIIFLTGNGDVPTAVEAMRSGAVDFLTKPVDESTLFRVIERALALDRLQQRHECERATIQQRLQTLTARQREVLTYVIAGLLNKQIADRMGAAEKTIKVHRGRMMKKMEASSVAELVRMADKVGVPPAE